MVSELHQGLVEKTRAFYGGAIPSTESTHNRYPEHHVKHRFEIRMFSWKSPSPASMSQVVV